jgi:radical SAM protein with 4Fe4S-binding SPASM domain
VYSTTNGTPFVMVRYNKEYFGFIAAWPDGEINLLQDSAEPLLNLGATSSELAEHKLTHLQVSDNFHLSSPIFVWLELTRKCNLTCPHCYISAGEPRSNELSEADFYRILDQMAELGVWGVAITGGEPTLHESFAKIVNRAIEIGLLVGVATNGTFLTRTLLDSLPREGVIINVSYDNLHIRDKASRADFKLVERAILLANSMGFRTNIMTNTNKANLGELEWLVEWSKNNGTSVRSVPFTPVGRGGNYPELENSVEDVDRIAKFWQAEKLWEREYHEAVGLCVGKIFDYTETLGYFTRRCSSGRSSCYISADGTVYPCTPCAAESLFSPGSLANQTLEDLWLSHWEIREFSWDNYVETCRGCAISDESYYCTYRCPAFSFARHGTFTSCGASEFQIVSQVVRSAVRQSM